MSVWGRAIRLGTGDPPVQCLPLPHSEPALSEVEERFSKGGMKLSSFPARREGKDSYQGTPSVLSLP
jgi:hypothetical protein